MNRAVHSYRGKNDREIDFILDFRNLVGAKS